MSFESFDAVRGQEEALLHDLLQSGDGPERVWAAWSLALRLGGESVSLLAGSAQPDPGVRAHFVVVLAGFGQIEALSALAANDPDPSVRATACDYLIRTVDPGRAEDIARFLEARACQDPHQTPVVRILRQLPADWPVLKADVLTHLLSHAQPEVRLASLAYIRRSHAGSTAPTELLQVRLDREREPEVLVQIAGLVHPLGEKPRILAAAERVPEAASPLLDLLLDEDELTDWGSLGALPHDNDPRIRLRCLRLCSKWTEPEAAEWLSDLAVATYRMPDGAFALNELEQARRAAHAEAQSAARERILALVVEPEFFEFGPLAPALRTLLSEVEGELAWLLTEDLDYLEEEGMDLDAELHRLKERRVLLQQALES